MIKIECSDARCKYCDDNYKCTNKNVVLNYRGINTKFEGYQHLLKCESFIERDDDWYKAAQELIKKMEKKND